jgi:DNA-binding GntR family transcriptional regulator
MTDHSDTRSAEAATSEPGLDSTQDGSMTSAPTFNRLPTIRSFAPVGEQLYRVLEEAITAGDLEPGERLDEKALAAHFGVSRIPLREALRGLEVAGWIERAGPRRGMRVREITESELGKLTEVRQILDGQCAAFAAQRRSDDQVQTLRGIVAQAWLCFEHEDWRMLVSLNTEFHIVLARCTQNEVFEEILSTLDKRVRRFVLRADADLHRESIQQHERLVDAIDKGDAREARLIARGHQRQHAVPMTALREAISVGDGLPVPAGSAG